MTHIFIKAKNQEEADPRDRFKPLKSNFLSGLQVSDDEKGTSDLGQQRLLPEETKASSSDETQIEYGKRFLPPLWVDLQEDIEHRLKETSLKIGELVKMQQKRMRVNFGEDNDAENFTSIDGITEEITEEFR